MQNLTWSASLASSSAELVLTLPVDLQDRFIHLANQMDEIVQLSEVEKERAEESAMAVQLEFDRALQRLQDGLQDMAEAAEGDRLVEGECIDVPGKPILIAVLTDQSLWAMTKRCGPISTT